MLYMSYLYLYAFNKFIRLIIRFLICLFLVTNNVCNFWLEDWSVQRDLIIIDVEDAGIQALII
jgi:hypothetical protein